MLPKGISWSSYCSHHAYLIKKVDKIGKSFEWTFVKRMQQRGHYDFMSPTPAVLQHKQVETWSAMVMKFGKSRLKLGWYPGEHDFKAIPFATGKS